MEKEQQIRGKTWFQRGFRAGISVESPDRRGKTKTFQLKKEKQQNPN